jgi:hypothetical protein
MRALSMTALAVAIGAGEGSSTAVRATLGTQSQPRATGVFVGSLGGRTLSWRLTFDGLGGAPAAHLHLRNGAVAARLCAPCASGVSGTAILSRAAATAVRARAAYVDVHAAGGGAVHGQVALGTVPTLQLVGLGDGAVLHLPAEVRYAVTGFRVGAGRGGIVLLAAGTQYRLRLGEGVLTVLTLPDDKMLTGRRDLTFVLTKADGTQLGNREARVTVFGVTLAGRR